MPEESSWTKRAISRISVRKPPATDQLAQGPTVSACGFAYSVAVVNRLPPPAVSRRALVGFAAGAAGAAFATARPAAAHLPPLPAIPSAPDLLRPARLVAGDVVGLVDPASATWEPIDIDIVEETLTALGLVARRGVHLLDRRGSLAGSDRDRAADVMAMFTDPSVKAVLPVRGGWGCARILPHLDFDAIRRNPKVLMGYSDLTALLLAIHARTGLVTFHGPNGASDWNPTSTDFFSRVVLKAEAVMFTNPRDRGETLAQTEYRIKTITPGTGASPAATDEVKVHYEGTLVNGKVFDSSIKRGEPATFPLNGVIPCWTEAVQTMKVGGKARIVCPAELAYGERGSPPQIRPNNTLVFDVELIEIVKPGANAGGAAVAPTK